MEQHTLFTDGGFIGKTMSWALTHIVDNKRAKYVACGTIDNEEYEALPPTSANAELHAVINAINYAIKHNIKKFTVCSDFRDILCAPSPKRLENLATALIAGHKLNVKNEIVLSYRIWLQDMIDRHGLEISFVWVPGHSKNETAMAFGNDLVDKLATLARKE